MDRVCVPRDKRSGRLDTKKKTKKKDRSLQQNDPWDGSSYVALKEPQVPSGRTFSVWMSLTILHCCNTRSNWLMNTTAFRHKKKTDKKNDSQLLPTPLDIHSQLLDSPVLSRNHCWTRLTICITAGWGETKNDKRAGQIPPQKKKKNICRSFVADGRFLFLSVCCF